MFTLALAVGHHTSLRLMEVAGAATAVAGGVLVLSGGAALGRRSSHALAGILLAAAGVCWVIAIRWGR